jgi:hypothetical protein
MTRVPFLSRVPRAVAAAVAAVAVLAVGLLVGL